MLLGTKLLQLLLELLLGSLARLPEAAAHLLQKLHGAFEIAGEQRFGGFGLELANLGRLVRRPQKLIARLLQPLRQLGNLPSLAGR